MTGIGDVAVHKVRQRSNDFFPKVLDRGAVPGGVNEGVRTVLGAVCACFRCESHFKHFLSSVVGSIEYFILYELQVSVFSHEINVLTDLGPEVGIGSNREVLFPLV